MLSKRLQTDRPCRAQLQPSHGVVDHVVRGAGLIDHTIDFIVELARRVGVHHPNVWAAVVVEVPERDAAAPLGHAGAPTGFVALRKRSSKVSVVASK